MILFAAFYIYFLMEVIMASKWKDSDFIVNELKSKINWMSSIVERWTTNVKNKISDESVIVIEKAKGLTQKAWDTIKEWKEYVIDKYKTIKTKLKSTKSTTIKKGSKSKGTDMNEKLVWELIKSNQELIDITKELINKYDKCLKLTEQINKNLSKKK